MDAAVVLPFPDVGASKLAFHDVVRTPDGRTGQVIGFYRRDVTTALVSLAPGDVRVFPIHELEIVRTPI